MNRFMLKIAQFMYGRNGLDGLGYAAMALLFLVYLASSFVHTIYLTIAGLLIVVLMLFRFLSKNLVRRRKENEVFMRAFNKVKSFFRQTAVRLRDFKKYRYRTCPGCKVTLRLPVKRGFNTVICPRCKRKIKVRVWI
jgi:hypothetical protein